MFRIAGSLLLACLLLAPGGLQAQARKGGGGGRGGAGGQPSQGAAGGPQQMQKKCQNGNSGQAQSATATTAGTSASTSSTNSATQLRSSASTSSTSTLAAANAAAQANAAAITATLQQATALLTPVVSQLQSLQLNNAAVRSLSTDLQMMRQIATSTSMSATQKQAQAGLVLQKAAGDLQTLVNSQNLPVSAQFLLAGTAQMVQQLGQLAQQAASP